MVISWKLKFWTFVRILDDLEALIFGSVAVGLGFVWVQNLMCSKMKGRFSLNRGITVFPPPKYRCAKQWNNAQNIIVDGFSDCTDPAFSPSSEHINLDQHTFSTTDLDNTVINTATAAVEGRRAMGEKNNKNSDLFADLYSTLKFELRRQIRFYIICLGQWTCQKITALRC